MKLKSFGCSFIFGSDLQDDGRHGPYATHSHLTWPALLAKDHNWAYSCYARPGAGNLEIADQVLSQLSVTELDPVVHVVGWTWIDRFGFLGSAHHRWGGPWRSIMPIDTDPVAEMYYKYIHSESRDKLTALINVKVVIDTLKQRGHKFIMTYMDDLMFNPQDNATPAIAELQDYCKPYMTRFDNLSFLDYSKENGFEISQTQHPLEPAHQAAFELIRSYNLV